MCSYFRMRIFINVFPLYVHGIPVVFSLVHIYSYIVKKQRIVSPRCDNYKVHYVPGVPENSKFNSLFFVSRMKMG